MDRETAFEKLWGFLESKGGGNPSYNNIDDSWLLYEEDDGVDVHLCRSGEDYEWQVYIEASGEWTTMDISVLLSDIQDHKWCWAQLDKIGFTKDMLGVDLDE